MDGCQDAGVDEEEVDSLDGPTGDRISHGALRACRGSSE